MNARLAVPALYEFDRGDGSENWKWVRISELAQALGIIPSKMLEVLLRFGDPGRHLPVRDANGEAQSIFTVGVTKLIESHPESYFVPAGLAMRFVKARDQIVEALMDDEQRKQDHLLWLERVKAFGN